MEWQWQKNAADICPAPMEAVAVSDVAAGVSTLKCCVSKSIVDCHLPAGWFCIPERRERTDADCQESGEL